MGRSSDGTSPPPTSLHICRERTLAACLSDWPSLRPCRWQAPRFERIRIHAPCRSIRYEILYLARRPDMEAVLLFSSVTPYSESGHLKCGCVTRCLVRL